MIKVVEGFNPQPLTMAGAGLSLGGLGNEVRRRAFSVFVLAIAMPQ